MIFVALTQKDRPIEICAAKRDGLTAKFKSFLALQNRKLSRKSQIHFVGDVQINTLESSHPKTYNGKSIVYATDFEHNPQACSALIDFAKDCDVLLYDAQYTANEYARYKGYGHSTPEEGIKVAEKAGAKKLVFVHHAPDRTDEALLQLEKIFGQKDKIIFAKVGDEL